MGDCQWKEGEESSHHFKVRATRENAWRGQSFASPSNSHDVRRVMNSERLSPEREEEDAQTLGVAKCAREGLQSETSSAQPSVNTKLRTSTWNLLDLVLPTAVVLLML